MYINISTPELRRNPKHLAKPTVLPA